MFKKLRNKLLIANTLIIAALILSSFSLIYLTVREITHRAVNIKLERAVSFAPDERDKHMRRPETEREGVPEGVPQKLKQEYEQFSFTFTVETDAEGNVIKKNMPFDMTEDFYTDKLAAIVSDTHNQGQIKSENGYWAYRAEQRNNGYIVAFTGVNAEHVILRNLIVALSIVAYAALAAAFFISLLAANRSIKPVEKSYNKQKQFIADASHELKTPLATINTNVDVLLSHEDSVIRDEKKWLEYIKTEAERMTKLTNELLYLARLDHKENSVITLPVSFSEAAEGVILLMEAVIFEKDIELSYDIAPDLTVTGNTEQLKQLVMILLDNACKYTPPKGDIKITLRKESSDAVLIVRNSGEGISKEALEHIFERFYREDKSRTRSKGGYGLGLSIADAIVKSYKGSIKAESEKDKYTQFVVKIPLVK